ERRARPLSGVRHRSPPISGSGVARKENRHLAGRPGGFFGRSRGTVSASPHRSWPPTLTPSKFATLVPKPPQSGSLGRVAGDPRKSERDARPPRARPEAGRGDDAIRIYKSVIELGGAKEVSMRRTEMRSSKGTKLYAVRDSKGRFKDIQTYKRAHGMD